MVVYYILRLNELHRDRCVLLRERIPLEIEHCPFPDDFLYDLEGNTWTRKVKGEVIIGVTSVLTAIAGKLLSARLKAPGTDLLRGRSLGTLESIRYVGPIPSPFSGTVSATNRLISQNPKVLNDSPYDEGWVARLKPSNFELERVLLSDAKAAEPFLRQRIHQFSARCFKAYPDHEMFEIGLECSAALAHLNDLIERIAMGEVVHLVSDDPTAYVEMVRWTDQTGHTLVDWRSESNLFHFIVRKAGS